MAVRHPQHGDLDALVAQSGDASRPVSFDHGSPLEFEAQLDEKAIAASSDSTTMPTLSNPLQRHAPIIADRKPTGIELHICGRA